MADTYEDLSRGDLLLFTIATAVDENGHLKDASYPRTSVSDATPMLFVGFDVDDGQKVWFIHGTCSLCFRYADVYEQNTFTLVGRLSDYSEPLDIEQE